MLVRSFANDHGRFIPVEVELSLWPGLPGIQFVGLPDQQIRESAWRIKSAIKSQGFEFPKARQILVNLRPNSIKKSSQGIELAVAIAYLMESGQIPNLSAEDLKSHFFYGSLSLSGAVGATTEVNQIRGQNACLVTGQFPMDKESPKIPYTCVSSLADLNSPLVFKKPLGRKNFLRPKIDSSLKWTKDEADFLAVSAAGGHHAMLAGPSGSGKSTMARLIHQLLPETALGEENIFIENDWRPLSQPHHSASLRGFLGGGIDIGPGEITRAHGGVLLLDEFLEFKAEVIESLRQPIEEGLVRLARGAKSETLPALFQLIATTNLCPCGKWIPGLKRTYCRFTLPRCRSYSHRLSGPTLDRFQILYFASLRSNTHRDERTLSAADLIPKIELAASLVKERNQNIPNARLNLAQLEEVDGKLIRGNLLPVNIGSERRRLATLRVARTLADLAGRKLIKASDLQQSLQWTYSNFQAVGRWD